MSKGRRLLLLVRLQQKTKMKSKEEELYMGFDFKWVSVVLMTLILQGFKTPICESWIKLMKKRKMIVEKSSFQKVCFPLDFQI